MLATVQVGINTQHIWMIAVGLGVGLLAVMGLGLYLMRTFFQSRRDEHKEEFKTSAPRTENPSAFMVASMQAGLQQTVEHESELARLRSLHKGAQETINRT